MFPIWRTFSVTSSPTVPSPRVSALNNLPLRYVRHIAVPSNFSSQLYVNAFPMLLAALSAKASTSVMSYVLPRDSIGYLWGYCSNSLAGPPDLEDFCLAGLDCSSLALPPVRTDLLLLPFARPGLEFMSGKSGKIVPVPLRSLPTLRVGESGLARSGNSCSRASSSFMRMSNS